MIVKTRSFKENINKLCYNKIENFLYSNKNPVKMMNRQAKTEKVFANHALDRRLVYRYVEY